MASVELNGNDLIVVCGGSRFNTHVAIDPAHPGTDAEAVRRAIQTALPFFAGMGEREMREVEAIDPRSATEDIRRQRAHRAEQAPQAQEESTPARRETIAGATPRPAAAHVELDGNEIVVVCRGIRRATGVSIDPAHQGSIEATVRRALQAAVLYFSGMGEREMREVETINLRAATNDILARMAPARIEREGIELVVSCGGMRHPTGVVINPNNPDQIEAAVRRAIRAAGPFYRNVGRAFASEVQAIDPIAAAAGIRQGLAIIPPVAPAQETETQRRRPARH